MLTFEQIKAIEAALGPEAAKPVVEAIQTTDQRVMTSLLAEVATKADLQAVKTDMAKLEGRMDAGFSEIRGDIKRLEMQIRLLLILAVLAIAMFSPNLAALLKLAR